jgi:hypothetical protein
MLSKEMSMTRRILMLAAFLGGCQSYATRTHSSEAGGTYVLSLASASDKAVHATDVIYDMQQECHGSDYEVTSIGTVRADDGVYLDEGDEPVEGPYRTVIAYECHAARNTELNHRLYVLAGPTLQYSGHGEHLVNDPSPQCAETWDCPVGQMCEARPCDNAAKSK